MLGPLAILCALLFPGGWAWNTLEQPIMVVAPAGSSATLPCKASSRVNYIHWYRLQEGMAPKRLLRVDMSGPYVRRDWVLKADKVNATSEEDSTSCTLSVLKLEKSDEGVYYCAAWQWVQYSWSDWGIKVFGPGTQLRVTDESPDEDMSPKPTVFLPSIAERKIHNVGTYLCLLEDFFPDVIKIDWKEKDGKRILTSQQGDTMKTNDTYMKFSWLTVTGASLDKEHKCIVKHKSKKTGIDQEILFPSINKELAIDSTKYEDATLQLQLRNTSAYYTYVILLLKSLVYSAITAFYLLGGPVLCGNGIDLQITEETETFTLQQEQMLS
ncbi:T-cell receptor gamma chain C region C10.5 isoform X3 [Ailuropoda melanoleuca]|uniref:T-cell receptor gamma chain C region C10.5 isoform X3 n=1 Tax=Ailuropoda melanoleuca TaxID=9646 RepID=UPI00149419C9|nr:T-cell receptor gamma chain C region C10.5 isoform X3 [Ailuropoda melanoleuca]